MILFQWGGCHKRSYRCVGEENTKGLLTVSIIELLMKILAFFIISINFAVKPFFYLGNGCKFAKVDVENSAR